MKLYQVFVYTVKPHWLLHADVLGLLLHIANGSKHIIVQSTCKLLQLMEYLSCRVAGTIFFKKSIE